jgi:ribonuclease BN (tRNA processing enzyme)
LVVIVLLLFTTAGAVLAQSEYKPSPNTKVVLLGTGTPVPDPDQFGPSVAIVVNNTPYLVDLGPGVIRRASAAVRKGVEGLGALRLKTAFITHLHSDHTVGYPDFIFSPGSSAGPVPFRSTGRAASRP